MKTPTTIREILDTMTPEELDLFWDNGTLSNTTPEMIRSILHTYTTEEIEQHFYDDPDDISGFNEHSLNLFWEMDTELMRRDPNHTRNLFWELDNPTTL